MSRNRKYFTDEEVRISKKIARKKWDDKNPEKMREIKRRWASRNREKLKPLWNLRDRRKRNAEGNYTIEDVERIYKSQKGKCAICSSKLGKRFHRDHIVPLALGGSNWASNIQCLCQACNQRKGAKDPISYMRSLGRLL